MNPPVSNLGDVAYHVGRAYLWAAALDEWVTSTREIHSMVELGEVGGDNPTGDLLSECLSGVEAAQKVISDHLAAARSLVDVSDVGDAGDVLAMAHARERASEIEPIPESCPQGLGCEREFSTKPFSSGPAKRHRRSGSPPCAMARALERAAVRKHWGG